ncbi:VanW family protein [Desulfoscipio geothermicus]|uniref:G5 domain-containing protein n=1 Tax=Desulfoscipio geothermicus DSM 3669 TaxID=1121426 RepID=A0A1I6DC18_9FIRM|nr:VanW family protein [Desulfoscipio geothermicus]SFR02948.1 G5 domain-containing protein [Desulfoscipio geothermicus DSM 3669]
MRRITIILVITVLIIAGVFLNFSGASFAISEKIINGVYVGPVDLSGLSREQAGEKLTALADKLAGSNIALRYGDHAWTVDAGSLGVRLDTEKTLQKALTVGHTGSILHQWRERRRVKRDGINIKPDVTIDRSRLEKGITELAGEIIMEPVNAGFQIMPDDSVKIVPGRMGTKVNFVVLHKNIAQALTGGDMQNAEVELPLLSVPPQRTTEDIAAMGINGLVARYATQFDSGQAGRTYNIKVAAAALDGLLIAPGEEFSFNRVVGPRSSEAGYKNANVIVNNELVQGLGGGVCQVSSTLYNAVLLANLKVTDRSNHSLPIGYVPIGRDATVVYDAIDFRFVNNRDYYVYIKSQVTGNTLSIKIYGNKEITPRVEVASWVTETIEPEVIYEKDPHLARGEQVVKQQGSKGYKAKAVRYIWQNDEKIAEALPASYYWPVNRIIAVGTAEVKPSVVIPSDAELNPDTLQQPVQGTPAGQAGDDAGAGPGEVGSDQPFSPEAGDGFGGGTGAETAQSESPGTGGVNGGEDNHENNPPVQGAPNGGGNAARGAENTAGAPENEQAVPPGVGRQQSVQTGNR